MSACESPLLAISTLDPGRVRVHGRSGAGKLRASREDLVTAQRREDKVEKVGAGAWEEDAWDSDITKVDETMGFRESPYVLRSFGLFTVDFWLRKAALRLCTHAPPLPHGQERHLRILEMKEVTLLEIEAAQARGQHLESYEEHHLNAGPIVRRELAILRGERFYGEYFDHFVLLLIIANTIFLAMDDPTSKSYNKHLFQVSEMFFNSIFTVEMLLKWFAMGVVSLDEKLGFMSEPWNRLDFMVVIIGWLPQMLGLLATWGLMEGGHDANFTAIRTLRVLKVLKTFQRVKGMQKIVVSLFSCWDILVNVLQLMIFMYFVFAIIGVQLFRGGLRTRCVSMDGDGYVMDDYCGSSWAPCTCNQYSTSVGFQCPSYEDSGYNLKCSNRDPRTRRASGNMDHFGNPGELSFDNVGIGFLTVLTCTSLEGWVDIMYQYMDSYGPIITVYFVVMISLLAFFVLNLVIAVIYEAFSSYGGDDNIVTGAIKLKLDERNWLTPIDETVDSPVPAKDLKVESHISWRDGMEYCHPSRTVTGPFNKFLLHFAKLRDHCCAIVNSSKFYYLVNILIVSNTALLATEHEGQACTFTLTLCRLNVFFSLAFALEMALKLLGIGLRNYLSDGFNIFDGTIVLFSMIEIVLKPICRKADVCDGLKVTKGKSVQVLRALRLLRVTRAIKMVKRWKSMSLIVNAIVDSGPGLVNFCSLLLLFMIIYALLGMQLFGDKPAFEGEFYNFDSLYMSLLTVFVVTTGENWNDTLYSTMSVQPYLGAIYTASMYIFGNYIVVNIFLAILLNNFDESHVGADGEEDRNLYSELSKTNEASRMVQFVSNICSALTNRTMVALGMATDEPESTEVVDEVVEEEEDMHSSEDRSPRQLNRISSIKMYTDAFIDETMDSMQAKMSVGIYRRGPGGSKIFYNCFRATDLIDCLIDEKKVRNLGQAQRVANRMLELNLIERKFPLNETTFQDDSSLYGFSDTSRHRLFLLGLDDGGAIKDGERNNHSEELAKKRLAMSTGKSLGMDGRHWLRRRLIMMVTHPLFDNCVLVLIILSSLTLALDEPQKSTAEELLWPDKILGIVDLVMTVLFFLEMASKILAMGFIGDKRCYMHDYWNILDFLIVCVSLVTLYFSYLVKNANDLTYLKSLRTMRVLRPLRMINRNPGMKMVVKALFAALPEVANVGLVSFGFFLGFGIMGLALLRGQLQYCEGDDEYLSEEDCTGTYDVNGHSFNRKWVTSPSNFDNIGSSLLTLFEMATLEGWPGMMSHGMEASLLGREKNAQPVNSLFYVAFIVIGAFLVINLFVGVVVNKFQEAKSSQDDPNRSLFLTEEQQRWRDEMLSILRYKVPHVVQEPEVWRRVRMPIFIVVQSHLFETFIMIVILLNVAAISLSHWNSGPKWAILGQWLNLSFTFIFTMEMVLKLIGLSWGQYIRAAWNKFDFSIVILSLVDVTLPGHNEPLFALPVNMSLFRVLRVARIAKLIKNSPGLKALMSTMIKSFPSLINVGSLLLLLFFIFAVMGMNLYGGYIPLDENDDDDEEVRECKCVMATFSPRKIHLANHLLLLCIHLPSKVPKDQGFLHKYSNFDTFAIAMLTLFRSLTGEDWNGIMHTLLSEGSNSAVVYFLSFTLLSNFILLNLVVAVILENFADFMDPGDPTETGKESDHVLMDKFREGWLEVDSKTELIIPDFMIVKLLYAIEPPLGFKGLREPIFHPPKGNYEALLKHTQFMVDYVRELNIYTTSDGNMHYVSSY